MIQSLPSPIKIAQIFFIHTLFTQLNLTFEWTLLFSECFRSYFLLGCKIYYLWNILLPYLLAAVAYSGKVGRSAPSATGTPKDNDVNDSSWCFYCSSQWKRELCKQHVSWRTVPAYSKYSLPGTMPNIYPSQFHKNIDITQSSNKEVICVFHKQDYSA